MTDCSKAVSSSEWAVSTVPLSPHYLINTTWSIEHWSHHFSATVNWNPLVGSMWMRQSLRWSLSTSKIPIHVTISQATKVHSFISMASSPTLKEDDLWSVPNSKYTLLFGIGGRGFTCYLWWLHSFLSKHIQVVLVGSTQSDRPNLVFTPLLYIFYASAVQPAARRLISCCPPVLAKFVRNNIMCKKSSRRQNLTWHLTISTQIKFFKFIKYMVLNPQVTENVM